MTKIIANEEEGPFLSRDWFDPLESGVRRRIRSFIEGILKEELAAALGRGRYDRSPGASGTRSGYRDRQLLGTFGPLAVSVPRARLAGADGMQEEWRSKTLLAQKRLTRRVEALIAGAYLAGTNTRRVRRALSALFVGAVGKDTVTRVGAMCRATGRPGGSAIWPAMTSCARSSTARWSRSGLTWHPRMIKSIGTRSSLLRVLAEFSSSLVNPQRPASGAPTDRRGALSASG